MTDYMANQDIYNNANQKITTKMALLRILDFSCSWLVCLEL